MWSLHKPSASTASIYVRTVLDGRQDFVQIAVPIVGSDLVNVVNVPRKEVRLLAKRLIQLMDDTK